MQVTIRFVVQRFAESRRDLTTPPAVPATRPANLSRYLEGDRLAPLDHEARAAAAKIVQSGQTPAEKARAIYEWIVRNFRFDRSGDGWGRGDLKFALTQKRGNAIDFNTAFTALARASGIPARIVFGFKIPRGLTEGNISEYHCWSEFWLDGFGWIPLDPIEGSRNPSTAAAWFGSLDAHRVAFTVGRDIRLAPPSNGEALNFFLYPHLEGDGQPLSGNAYRFSFKDEPTAAPAAAAPKAAPPAPAGDGMTSGVGRPDPNAP
jgi:hypothetical protein